MFTHINILTSQSFTTGETVTGSTSSATAIVQSITSVSTKTINSITVASPGVVTISAGHNYLEGQQVTISSVTGFEIDSIVQSAAKVFTVKNPTATTFELYDTDGTSSTNVTAYTSGGSVAHGVVVVSNVKGTFNAGETITGSVSSNTAIIKANVLGFNGVRNYDFPSVKQLIRQIQLQIQLMEITGKYLVLFQWIILARQLQDLVLYLQQN